MATGGDLGRARHIGCMGDDLKSRFVRKVDPILGSIAELEEARAEAERRGIDTRGKTLGEIRKLLAALGNGKDKPLSP